MQSWLRRVLGSKTRFQARVVGTERPFDRLELRGDVEGRRIEVPPRTTVEFRSAHARRIDFSNQAIANFGAFGTEFDDCDFSRTSFGGGIFGHLPQVTYRRCRFIGADLRQCSPLWARFEKCDFSNARLDDWQATEAEFVECKFAGRLLRVKFSGRPRRDPKARYQPPRTVSQFEGNDFSAAEFIDCSFSRGIRLTDNKMPTGLDYVLVLGAVNKLRTVRDQVLLWPESEKKQNALIWLDVFSRWGYQDQDELFVRRDEIAPGLHELIEAK